MSYNIAIVGSRNFTDKELFEKIVSEVVLIEGIPKTVISGGAVGADTLAYEWAIKNKIEFVICEPKYKDFPKKSRNWMAPKERNTRIVENSEIVLAF
jgi:predicted Rossmann fold nucleotide-binding protein DprA/Smf involved in DNA uptake